MQYNVESQLIQNTHDGQASWHHFVAMELNRKAGVYDQMSAASVTDSSP